MADSTSEESNALEVKTTKELSRGNVAVTEVSAKVDKLAKQVSALETAVDGGTQITEKEILYLTEMLMRQLLKLDAINAEGDEKVQRKVEVHRVQGLVEKMDSLNAKKFYQFSKNSADHPVVVATHWETFESGGSNVLLLVPSSETNDNPEQTPWATLEPSNVGNVNGTFPLSSSTQVVEFKEMPQQQASNSSVSSYTTPNSLQSSMRVDQVVISPTLMSSSGKVNQVQEQPQWQAFSPGVPGHSVLTSLSSSTKVTQDWEQFD